MEGPSVNQYHQMDRSRASLDPRAASRSSTSSTRTRMTTQSNNSSTSHAAGSPITPSHPHRYHHAAGSRISHLSRETSADSIQSLPPVSNFLQERLQRERKIESERLVAQASNDMMSASLDLRTVQSSPPRGPPSEGRRPMSSGSRGEATKKKGLGLKEMEQVASTLHKKNFDLKLELFHRRERQAALEGKLDKLEKEKEEADEENERLGAELKKRDKAVEEAVAMIVSLEARVEQLLREREMVHRMDAAGYFHSQGPLHRVGDEQSTPRTKGLGGLDTPDEAMSLNRMPSFLSEHSENTDNLRNVYLGARGSILSLSRMAEDGPDGAPSDLAGIRSPSLSVLSESSFLSVYGQKRDEDPLPSADDHPSPLGGPLDGPAEQPDGSGRGSDPYPGAATPTWARGRSTSQSGARSPAKFQNVSGILDLRDSPLQRLEKLDKTLVSMSADGSSSSGRDPAMSQSGRRTRPQGQPRTKQEKREALERVLTNVTSMPGYDTHHPNVLPPTPDTVSTSTLRRFKNSNDTLSQERGLLAERSYLALSESTTGSQPSLVADEGTTLGVEFQRGQFRSAALEGHREPLGSSDDRDVLATMAQTSRPRSAGEATAPQHHRLKSWDMGSSEDERPGSANSATSTYDYWMRESLEPNRPGVLGPLSSVSQAGPGRNTGRISPDLFSFPMNTGSWATDAMFGSLGGSGYLGSAGQSTGAPPLSQALEALGQSLPSPLFASGLAAPALGTANVAPPPPHRRSSLHARTGSTSAVVGSSFNTSPTRPTTNGKLWKSPGRPGKTRSNSIDGRPPSHSPSELEMGPHRASTVPPKQFQAPPPALEQPSQPPAPKPRHYPPTASQASRPRGLNLFRRSTGSADVAPPEAPLSAPPTAASSFRGPHPLIGVPSWGKRSDLGDDERLSATPPPILRNKVPHSYANDDGGGASLGNMDGGAPVGFFMSGGVPDAQEIGPSGNRFNGASNPPPLNGPAGTVAKADAAGGGKRKWLGLGRVSSLRNRAS